MCIYILYNNYMVYNFYKFFSTFFTEMDFIRLFKLLFTIIIVANDLIIRTTGNVIDVDHIPCINHQENCKDVNLPLYIADSNLVK